MSNKAIKSDMNKTDTEGRTDDEDDDQYEEALEDMNLNETQAMELIQLLEKLEDEESKRTAITNTRNWGKTLLSLHWYFALHRAGLSVYWKLLGIFQIHWAVVHPRPPVIDRSRQS